MKDTCHLIIRVTLIPVVVLNCFTLFKVYTVDANEMENQRFLKKKKHIDADKVSLSGWFIFLFVLTLSSLDAYQEQRLFLISELSSFWSYQGYSWKRVPGP